MKSGRGIQTVARWNTWILIAWLAGPWPALGRTALGDEGTQGLKINVRVCNYTHVSDMNLERAEKGAAEIFRQAGLEVSWANCNRAHAESYRDPNCTSRVGPLNLDVRIVQSIPVVPGVTDGETMGLAFRDLASISLRQVTEEASAASIEIPELLGEVMAHELGHLLLGPNSHSQMGVMRPRWTREDYRRVPRGQLIFTPQQGELIRGHVRARTEQQAAAERASATGSN